MKRYSAVIGKCQFLLAGLMVALLVSPALVAPQKVSAAPASPTNLTATVVSSNRVDLAWTDNSTGELGFHIARALDSNFTNSVITITVAANAIASSDTTVTPGTTVSYRVTSFDATGDSPPSNVVTIAVPAASASPPLAPTGLTATVISANQVNLTWNDNATNETAYRVERATNSTFTGAVSFALAANSVAHSDATAAPATTYFYRVLSSNASGDSAPSNSAQVATPDIAPAAPTGLAAIAANPTQVNLTWADNANNETAYRVERATDPAFPAAGLVSVPLPAGSTTHTDVTVAAATTYHYRVIASNAVGSSTSSNIATVTTPSAGVPATPTGLGAVTAGPNQVNLTWTDSANNETAYRVDRATDAAFTAALVSFTLPANSTNYSDTAVAPVTIYHYRISASNAAGNSPFSNTATVATPDTAPRAPTGLTATAAGPTQVNLAWTDNATNEAAYRVDRATDAAFTIGLVSFPLPANTTIHSDITAAPVTVYFYRVSASNAIGNSDFSNTASAVTPDVVPATPTNLVATVTTPTQVNLSWTDNATNETAYRVERATDAGFPTFVSFSLPANSTAYSDVTAAASTTYFYRVFASNATGSSSPSNKITAVTGDVVPSTPSGLTVTAASHAQVTLAWTDNASNENAYRVERAADATFAGTSLVSFPLPANATSFSDTTPVPVTTYYYRVFASNGAGNSPPSNVVNITTPTAAIPPAPTALTATATSPTQVNLTWTDNAANETAYRVQRATDITFTASLVSVPLPANSTTYSDTTAVAVTTYHYRVLASNALGDSQPSNTATVSTPDVLPAAPTNLTAVAASPTQVTLTWTDNATNETAYRVERATVSTFTTGLVSFPLVANATTYYYRILASNATGPSAASNVATVTTPAAIVPAAPSLLTATLVGASQVNLAWTDNATNETAYRVERATDTLFITGLVSFPLSANVTTYSDPILAGATTYYYRVMATNATGNSLPSNTATVFPSSPAGAPTAPSNLTGLAAASGGVSLTWTDNATNETAYRVERATDSTFVNGLTSFITAANSFSYTDTTTLPITTYQYRVMATNASGNSTPSNTVSVTTGISTTSTAVPATPSGLIATVAGATTVNLTWSDNAANETSYRVERATDSTFFNGLTSFLVAANSVSYSNTTAAPSTTYFYRVLATNASGNSTPSNVVSTTTPAATASATSSPPAPASIAVPAAATGPTRPVILAGFTSNPTLALTASGNTSTSVQLKNVAGKLTIDIASGTRIVTAAGQPAQTISSSEVSSPPAAPARSAIIATYAVEPSGIQFDRPVTLTIKFDPAALPAAVSVADLYIAYWNGATWQNQTSTVDAVANTVSAKVTHFSVYAVMGKLLGETSVTVAPGVTISGLSITPRIPKPGESVTIALTAASTLSNAGKHTLILKVNGVEEGKREIKLAAGATQKVTFAIAKKAVAAYDIDINGLKGSFSVQEAARPSAAPQPGAPSPVRGLPLWAIAAIVATLITVGLLVYALRPPRSTKRP